MKKYLVIGNPIEHSLSPKLHSYWIKKNNIDAIYEKEKLDESSLENLILKVKDKIIGNNTDINGFELSIKRSKFDLFNKKVFILGAGGVVPSIIYALNKMKVSKIFICNRTREKAENLKKLFNNLNIIEWGEIPDFDIIINATSLGLKKEEYNNRLSNYLSSSYQKCY